ncbi:hypothetical protein OG21DRAFT_1514672 [Imleria badia]|nr:hypothetical protein OG21DRAFT_1514672 [Imleria badia]
MLVPATPKHARQRRLSGGSESDLLPLSATVCEADTTSLSESPGAEKDTCSLVYGIGLVLGSQVRHYFTVSQVSVVTADLVTNLGNTTALLVSYPQSSYPHPVLQSEPSLLLDE